MKNRQLSKAKMLGYGTHGFIIMNFMLFARGQKSREEWPCFRCCEREKGRQGRIRFFLGQGYRQIPNILLTKIVWKKTQYLVI